MPRYALVVVDIEAKALDRPFTYRIPVELRGKLGPGSLVEIPFGKGDRVRSGYCVGFSDDADYPDEKIKSIRGLGRQEEGTQGSRQIRLAHWMKQRYGCTLSAALKVVVTARKDAAPVVTKRVELALTREEAKEQLAFFAKKHQVARLRLLEELVQTPVLPYSLITQKLHVPAQTIRAMQEKGILRIEESKSLRNPIRVERRESKRLILSKAQTEVVEGVFARFLAIREGREKGGQTFLLHGITGSGKTACYIELIEKVVATGAKAIMLIPEIALTYQTLVRFYERFGERVSVMNSSLSEAEKADQYERARRGEIDVIIGPRSALFTPFADIGVIVIDEEHESSYKNESMPKYHARETAAAIAALHGGVVLLGSATPSLEAMYGAKTGKIGYYRLGERLTGQNLPEVSIADLREELKAGNRSILSRKLRAALEERLSRGEQTMLFLNRRGVSGFVSCRSCGYVARCPHCDVSLSLHGNRRLVCHYCGYEIPMMRACPSCGSPYIAGFRAGTESVQEMLHRDYPQARILRMDADTTARKGAYEHILQTFANEEADILVGTQMIVKGHDFPKVTLVGILLADMSLYANDYRAGERTFSLLTQAAGRAGRGEKPGEVVIQTYEPEHYALEHAKNQDYEGFYREEIEYRRKLMYPPVYPMVALQFSSENEDHARKTAVIARDLLEGRSLPDAVYVGPTEAGIGKIRDIYRFVLYIKSANYGTLTDCRDWLEGHGWPFPDVQVQYDFNPMSLW